MELIKYFANLKFAISVLVIIASISIIGTVIEQDRPIDFYKLNYNNLIFLIPNWKIILEFGLDRIFKTWWFISLLLIFGNSLICCTFLQQFPLLIRSKKYFFYKKNKQYPQFPFNSQIINIPTGNIVSYLKTINYTIFQQSYVLYAYKGLIGRIAPIVVHISLILILLGAIIGSITGFIAQEFIPNTEIFYIQNILSSNRLSYLPKIFTRVNDFWITYKKNGIISQFYSDLSITDNMGYEIKRQTISVNKPFKYQTVTYYQTDWSILGIRLKINNNIYQIPLINSTQIQTWFTWLPNSNGENLIVNNSRGNNSVYTLSGKFLTYLDSGEKYPTIQPKFQIIEIIVNTGLQIKSDPGIVFIYIGFGILMLSVSISYISFSQIWLLKKHKSTYIGGITNRAQLNFKLDTLRLILVLSKNKFN